MVIEGNEIKAVVVMDYLDKPSPYSNNIYPTEVVQKAIDVYNAQDVKFGTLKLQNYIPTVDAIPIDQISHKINNLRIEGNRLLADITILEKLEQGALLKALIENGHSPNFRCGGYGMIADGTVTDYTLVQITAVKQEDEDQNG